MQTISLRVFKIILFLYLIILLVSCNDDVLDMSQSPFPVSDDSFVSKTIATGFTIPYGIAVINEEEYFITDRIGKLYHIKGGLKTEIFGLPEVSTFGTPEIPIVLHGGLMDVSAHPSHIDNSWLYISYLDKSKCAMVSRFKVEKNRIISFENIFTTKDQNRTGNGMRIVWEDDTHFFLNIGSTTFSTKRKPLLNAQDLNDDAGKIHRLNDDGTIPSDNPIFENLSNPTSIWSYGHRDVQGLFYEKSSKTLFGLEHGPKGGDEFNIIKAGGNYGWPLFTYGINYDGAEVSLISKEEASISTVLPEHYWTIPTNNGGQALAPACLLKVDNSSIKELNNFFLFGSLAFKRLMKYDRVTKKTYGLSIEGRVRTIKQLPSGNLIGLIERSELGKTDGKIIIIK